MSSCRRMGHWPSRSHRQTTEKLQNVLKKGQDHVPEELMFLSLSLLPKHKLPRALNLNCVMTQGPVMIWLQGTLWSLIQSSWSSAASTRGQQRTAKSKLQGSQLCEIKATNSGERRQVVTLTFEKKRPDSRDLTQTLWLGSVSVKTGK